MQKLLKSRVVRFCIVLIFIFVFNSLTYWGVNKFYLVNLSMQTYEYIPCLVLFFLLEFLLVSFGCAFPVYIYFYGCFVFATSIKAYFQIEFLNIGDLVNFPELVMVLDFKNLKLYIIIFFFILLLGIAKQKHDLKKLFAIVAVLILFNIIVKFYFINSIFYALKIPVWTSRQSTQMVGPLSYFWLHALRYEILQKTPSDKDVIEVYKKINISASTKSNPSQIPSEQNIYFFVVESFWDPTLILGPDKVEDPFASEYRALEKKHGLYRAVVPDFSGGTTHSEFEILCGLPISDYSVIFKFNLNDNLDCLPRVLADM